MCFVFSAKHCCRTAKTWIGYSKPHAVVAPCPGAAPAAFCGVGLQPDPLHAPAGGHGLTATCPPSSLWLTWGPLKELFAFPEVGSVPDSPPAPCPRPGRSSSAVLQHPHTVSRTANGSGHQHCGKKRLLLWLLTQEARIGLSPSLFSVLALTIHPHGRCSFVRTTHPSHPHGGKRPLGRQGYGSRAAQVRCD